MSQKSWYTFEAQAGEGTAKLEIFGPIGGGWFYDEDPITGKAIAQKLDGLGEDIKTIRVLINSPGGSVFDAIHIANALRRQREEFSRSIEVEIEALAASAATIVTSAGNSVKMPRNALLMVHMPVGWAEGPRATMLKVAEGLERAARAIVNTYRWLSKLKTRELRALMEETTWMDAEEALENGFITEIVDPVEAQAGVFLGPREAGGPSLEELQIPDKYRAQVLSLFKTRGCPEGVSAGAEFADLANAAVDARVEDEDITRAEVLTELVAATEETLETIEDILSGELECPEAAIVSDFVAILPMTQAQADTALEADGCQEAEEEDKGSEDKAGEAGEGEKPAAGDGDQAEDLLSARGGRAPGGKKMSDEKKTNEEDQKKKIAAAEKSRIMGINKAAAGGIKAGLPEDKIRARADAAIKNDTELEDFRAAVLDELAEVSDRTGPPPNGGHTGIEAGEDERDKRITGMQAALWARAGVTDTIRAAAKKRPDQPAFQELEFNPGEFRGMTLLDHARATLERSKPGSSSGLSKMQIAGNFFAQAGQQTTSDFPVALENALHKTLLAAYTIAPDFWRLFCSVGTVADFRPHPKYTRGYLAKLREVKESGEYKNQAVPDAAKEVQQAATYGEILALTRQAIINDDMGVFNDIAMMLGRAAALSIEEGVFDLLKLNSGLGPDMQDTNPLFDAAHSNLGAGVALSVAGIDADRVVMASQTDSSGNEVLDLRPAVLVIPIGLGGAARVLNQSQYDHDGTEMMKPNAVVGLFRDIADSARITGTRRYMFADPAVSPVIEVAFLDGEQDPYMEMTDGWRIDGVEWKVRHDFGIAAIDWRGAVTDPGV
ncbi:MAG: hypothetical protein GY769_01810 [bacterium]|nr:hypothetical protein [bacterium]